MKHDHPNSIGKGLNKLCQLQVLSYDVNNLKLTLVFDGNKKESPNCVDV